MKKLFLFIFILSFNACALPICPHWTEDKMTLELHLLDQKLMQLNSDYWEKGISSVSDEVYDQLKEHYRFLKNCFPNDAYSSLEKIEQPILTQDKLNHKQNVAHPIAHIGVKKIYTHTEALDWFKQRPKVWLQPKIDGVAITLVYQKGNLISAISRGDNKIGNNWLPAILQAKNIPNQIETEDELVILQGEIFWKVDQHKQAQDHSIHYRTQVATLLMQNNPNKKQLEHLYFWVWEWANGSVLMSERLTGLKKMGFHYGVVDSHWIENEEQLLKWRQYYYESPQDYATDGVVLKEEQRLAADQWLKQAPYWQIAWKHPAKTQITTIKNIDYSIGRTGKITPFLLIEPTQIDQKTFRKVSMHSLKTLEKADLALGDLISIRLRGDAIPLLDEVILRKVDRIHPILPKQSDFNALTCLSYSKDCDLQFSERLRYLIGKKGLNLKLSLEELKTLIRNHQIKTLYDLLSLSDSQLIESFNVNQVALQKWHTQVELLKQKDLKDWLQGYGLNDPILLSAPIQVNELHQCDSTWLNQLDLTAKKRTAYQHFFQALNQCES